MNDQRRSAVRRLASFSAGAAFGVLIGFASLMALASSVDPAAVGGSRLLVAVVFALVSAAAGVVATPGLGYVLARRQVGAVFGLVCGAVLVASLVPVLGWAFARLGPLPIGLIVGAVGLAAAGTAFTSARRPRTA